MPLAEEIEPEPPAQETEAKPLAEEIEPELPAQETEARAAGRGDRA